MQTGQAKKLREVRELLNVTTEGLAERLGRPLATVRAWLLPKTSTAHRTMPEAVEKLLERLLVEALRLEGKRVKRRKKKA